MRTNREKAIAELIAETQGDPDHIALILVGSSATGEAKDDSDIDLYLVVSAMKYRKIEETKDFFYGTWDPARYSGIEVDGKIIDLNHLRQAAIKANDASRYQFNQAKILFCKDDEIEKLIEKIPVFPESEYLQRTKLFLGYVKHFRYIGEDAFTRNNRFLALHCVIQLITFSGRLVLAANKRLYPCHKRLLSETEKCARCPKDFVRKSNDLLENITLDAMLEYYEMVFGYFKQYDHSDTERIGTILEDEWIWKTGKLPVSEM